MPETRINQNILKLRSKYSDLRLFRKRPGSFENEAVEDEENDQRAPVISDDQGCVEDGILEELDHTLARIEVPLTGEMLPAENAHKEEYSGHHPRDHDHGEHLAMINHEQ